MAYNRKAPIVYCVAIINQLYQINHNQNIFSEEMFCADPSQCLIHHSKDPVKQVFHIILLHRIAEY